MLFDFVDVSAKDELMPGTYRLVAQFPRRVFSATDQGTLQDVGLNSKQESVLVEKS